MKKKVFSLMMTLLLAFVGVAKADGLTVNDGTASSSYIPFYGLYADTQGCTSECIIPASDLADMAGGTISEMTFYLNQSAVAAWTATWQVYLAEVDATTLSGVGGPSAGTVVYEGTLDATGTELTITFDTPYTYNGGNLLVGSYVLTAGNYKSASFYGVSTVGATGYHQYGSSSYQQGSDSFLPKMTFDYTPGGGGGGEVVPYEAQIGDGTSTTGYFPLYTLYNYNIAENLFLASELTAAGVLPGEVTSLSWYANNETGDAQQGISIWMANVSDTELTTSSHVTTGMTLVYTGTMTPAMGWNEFPCNAGTFTWDGTSNVLIFCQRNNGGWGSTINWQYTATTFNSVSYTYQDSGAYDVTVSNTMYTGKNRSNIIIKGVGAGGGEATDTYVYDMESGLDGWTSIDNDEDGNDWFHSSESETYSCYDYTGLGYGHDGSDGFAISASYSDCTGYPLDADNYLVLPQSYAIENGAYLNFFYDYGSDTYPDYFEVCVATTADMPTAAADFTPVWSIDMRNGNAPKTHIRHSNNRIENWREVTVYLNAYVGQTVWIAIHHQDYDNYELWIDDVTVYVGDPDATLPIAEVYINDFVEPVWGQPVAQEVTLPEEANYTLFGSGWFAAPHGREMNPDPIYNLPDQDYYWGFILAPNDGYAFTPDFTAYINDSEDMVLLATLVTPAMAQMVSEFVDDIPEGAALVVANAYYLYEEGLHTLSTYGVGGNAYESVDRLLIERPNGAWMEPYHFQLYNDGEEDVEVVLIDFLHNNGYFSMAEGTEYPIAVAAEGRPGVDLYINTNIDWTETAEINSLLAVNTSERSTHLYQIVAAPYTPYCPDVVETAYRITNIDVEQDWHMWTSEMWEEENPNIPYELHANYDLPDFAENIPDGYDAVMTFTLDHDMMLSAYVSDGECDGELNGKVALYRADFGGQPGPMADNYYEGRPFHNDGGGSTPGSGSYTSINFETGNFSQFNNFTNNSAYPWVVSTGANVAHGGTYGMKSNCAGVDYGLSQCSTTVNYTAAGTVSFDYFASGEGSGNYIWDKCIFQIDGVEQFRYGAVNAWNSFNANVAAGQHTFTWIYQKDGSVNPTGDFFAVDNIVFDGGRLIARTPRGNRATAVNHPELAQTLGGSRNTNMTNWHGMGRGSDAYGICVYNNGGILDEGVNYFDIENIAGASVINSYDGVGGMVCNPTNGHFYVSDYDNSLLYELDADGTLLNTVETNYQILSLAWDATTSTLYSLDSYGWLNITDPATGDMTDIDLIDTDDIICITANAAGQIYGLVLDSPATLVTISKTDATTTVVGELGANSNYAQSMAFDLNTNELYWAQCYSQDDMHLYKVNLSTLALETIANNPGEICGLCIPAAAAPTPVDPDQPDQPAEHAYSAGPVIDSLNVLAGTYYLVASSTCEDFEVSIDFEELPCPIAAVTGIWPEDNADSIEINHNNQGLTLRWTLDDYCNEYRLVFGSTYYPDDEPNHPATYIGEWSSDLAESFRITDSVVLWNNTNYFWRIDQRSNPGTPYECVTRGPVFGFTTCLNAPTNLQASNTRIFENEETVTLSWTPIQDRTYRRYRIYMDGVRIYQTPNNQVVTSWDIPMDSLTYNMDNEHGYIFEVSAVYDEGESPKSNPVEIWVSGNGTVSGHVYEQDETTPIGGVTVTITGTNEFDQTETYTYTTDNEGYYHGNIHAGTYGYAVATMAGYQNAETTHELPFDVVYDEETEDVDFIMDELFIAPAHVCAQTTYVEGVEGDSLVQVWWDFNFFTTLTEDFEDWDNTPYAWVNNSTYPWALTTDAHEGTYAFQSGNAGVASSTSELSVTVEIPQDGQFSFDYRCQGEGTYTYWDHCDFVFDGQTMFSHGADLSGWQSYSMPITAGSHTFKWSYTKDSSLNPTGDNFTIDNIVFVGHADRADRSLHHYNIYRTDCYNENPTEDEIVFLASVWRPDTSYFDVNWPDVPVGVYKWGVSAVYAGNQIDNPNNPDPALEYPFEGRESEIVWSDLCGPCIDKDMYLDSLVTVNVVLNSADSPEGVQVSFQNLNPGEQFNHPQEGVTLDQTGYYVFPRFRKGTYMVTVGLPGYETLTVEESIWEPRDLRYVLTEIICTVQNLYVSRTGWAMWDPQAPCPGGIAPGPTPGPDDPTGGNTYTYDFEEDLQGWTNIINGEGDGWIVATDLYTGTEGYGANGSDNFAMGYSYADGYSYDCDDYLVSPQAYALGNGANLNFYHDQQSSYYSDYMEVCVSTAETPTASSFTAIWNNGGDRRSNGGQNREGEPFNRLGNWSNVTLDLSAYAGQNVWIAFHHEAYDQYAVLVDDVTVTTGAGRAATAERHLEGYKVMCTSIDGEHIFSENTVHNFCQLAINNPDALIPGNTYKCKVAAIYSTGMSEYEEVDWLYQPCYEYAGTVNGVTAEGNTITWDYPGSVPPGPGPDPEPTEEVTVVLNVPGDPWEDGSGYQLILDADHNQYGNQIPSDGNFTAGSFAEFEYTIPENAVCDLNTNTIVLNGSATITIPAGVYDYAFLNPSPDYGTYYISSDYGQFPGRGDDYEFEAGKTYTFTVTVNNYDNITLVITDNDGRFEGYACNRPAVSDNSQCRRAENHANATIMAKSWNVNTTNFDNRDGWIYYDNGVVSDNILGLANQGTGEVFPFSFGVMFPAGSYQGNTLTKAAYYDPAANTGNIEIYQGGTTAPTTLVYSQPYSTTGAEDFVEFTFTTPVTIDPAQSLWVVFHTDGGFVAALDTQAGNANGMWLYSDLLADDWQTVYQATGGAYNGNWMIRAYVEEGTTPPTPPTPAEGILGAMIFVDGEWEAFVEAPINTYTYEGEGENICVRIVYDGTAELPANNFYYAMSCEECVGDDTEMCPAGAPIFGDVDVNDQIRIWWGNDERSWHGKIVKYNVYRSTDNVDYALIGEVSTARDNYYEYFDAPVVGGTYYYQVTAVYSDGCESAPAISGENPDQNYVMFGITGIGENNAEVNLFPNPTMGNVTIQAMNMHRITVVSVLGQVVFDTELDQDEYILNMAKFNTGMYMVRVYTDEGVTVKRVTVLH